MSTNQQQLDTFNDQLAQARATELDGAALVARGEQQVLDARRTIRHLVKLVRSAEARVSMERTMNEARGAMERIGGRAPHVEPAPVAEFFK